MSSFCPVSLGDWLAVCAEAGVPAVPAEIVAEFEQHDVLCFDQEGPHQERLRAAFAKAQRSALPRHMFRWDCCASMGMKMAMDGGGVGRWEDEWAAVPIPDDPRAFDIIYEYPRFVVPMWRTVLFLEGGPPHLPTYGAHPCCFRAGEIEGVALEDRNDE